jgi:hypothetical protein
MSQIDSLRDNLDFVSRVAHHSDQPRGVPALYFLWAVLVAIGFALPDFAPRAAGPYWFVAGIGGGLLSWWQGDRHARKAGFNNKALGRRYAMHWTLGGVGFLLAALPFFTGRVELATATGSFLLVGGLVYGLAGVHLERPLLWSGLLMLAGYAVLEIFAPPWLWTITGIVIAISLLWAGLAAQRQRLPEAPVESP